MKFDLFSLVQKRDESWGDRKTYERLAENIKLAEEIGLDDGVTALQQLGILSP